MRKRKCQIKVLPAAEYWNKVLNMDYPTEFARYKYLCGYLPRKKLKLPDSEAFITYHDWRNYIEHKLEKLNTKELVEFYHFLNSRVRSSSITKSITNNFMIPFIISFYIPHIVNELLEYAENTATFYDFEAHPEIRLIMLLIYILALVIIIGTLVIRDFKNDELKQHYYEDIKYIVEIKLGETDSLQNIVNEKCPLPWFHGRP